MMASGRTVYDGIGMLPVAIDVLDRRLPKPSSSCVGAHLGGKAVSLDETGPEMQGF